ncbi:hypothetical protein ACFWEJ_21820 [Promicromonospora sp. NPDC060204]|uniref:DUF308 domain-containing protein n=1 Tax=Promicromonospora sp. NPDC060204 TaxID=3347071 RepID=UPI00364EF9CF
MSAARVGEWHLLDYDDDPVPAEASGLDAVIKHYKEIAEMMTTQAALLKKIGDGDETLLKGESADAMRKRARESHEALGKAAGRYDDVHSALVAYQPELETARSETGKALAKAQDASTAQRGAEGMEDPVNADRPDDAPPLTEKEKQASQKRTDAINGAKGDLAAAKAIAVAAMEALATAAQTASNKIRENWGDDGLKHSGWEAFVHGFNKFIKKLVEVLSWIGMALAILAILIPGVGALAMAALIVAGIGLVFSFILAVQGEDSWVNVIMGALGFLTLGVGALAMKVAQGALNFTKIMSKFTQFIPKAGSWVAGPGGAFRFVPNFTKISGTNWSTFFGKLNPSTWDILRNPMKFWNLKDVVGLPSIEALKNLKALSIVGNMGVSGGVKAWVYFAGPLNFFFGFAAGAFGLIVPESAIFEDTDTRDEWSWSDWDYNHNFTGTREPI